jgi:hypothetical protein
MGYIPPPLGYLKLKPGDKLVFTGKTKCFHTNIEENANKLSLETVYTLKKISAYSSWTSVELEEVEGKFSLSFFSYENQ